MNVSLKLGAGAGPGRLLFRETERCVFPEKVAFPKKSSFKVLPALKVVFLPIKIEESIDRAKGSRDSIYRTEPEPIPRSCDLD